MKTSNFAYLTGDYATTPPELVGMYPLGGGGIFEVAYRHYFEFTRLKQLLSPLSNKVTILEFGCGNGRWALSFSPLVDTFIGVDSTPECVKIARELAFEKRLTNVSFSLTSVTEYIPDRYLDIVYFSGVSQYLEDEELRIVMRNIRPWIKDNTLIVDRSTFQTTQRKITNTDSYYSIYRTVDELASLFKEEGYTLVERKRSYRYLSIGPWLARVAKSRPRIESLIYFIITKTQPLSLWIMLLLSFFLDLSRANKRNKIDWSHDFVLFKKR